MTKNRVYIINLLFEKGGIFMNKNLQKLNILYSEIEAFRITYPIFYFDLLKIIVKHTDNFLIANGFSLKIRNLFRILLEDDCNKIKINSKDFKIMKSDINKLMFDHLYAYIDFADLVKRHIRCGDKGFGYNKFTRLLFGEPPMSVYNDSPGFRQAFSISKLITETVYKDDDIINLVKNYNNLIKKVYPESCFRADTDPLQ